MTAPSPDISIALGSAVIALCALLVSIRQLSIQRKHNRLSVRPHLDAEVQRNRTDAGLVMRYSIENTGLGPAIVKKRLLYLDGVTFTPGDEKPVEALLERMLTGKITYKLGRHSLPGETCAIKPSESVCICEIFFPALPKSAEAQVDRIFSRSDIEIQYESFYGDKFTFDTRSKK